ncbi:glycosyltransferase family 2 protein [Clostridium sp. AF22-10]|uniref:glycosyltransferase family 2 protein n=1 Tax=Clostridium sp. AF22-10 TaxID=2293004 RepID=UPI0026AEA47A
MEITTTIIIPNYNGLKFMDECIRSLNAQTYPNFRTLVVDNGSTDGSVEWLKEHQIDTIFLPENTGFSGAVNVGIKAADTPYVLLLNNDVRVDEYFVAEMVRAIGQSERIFSVSSRMIQMYHQTGWMMQAICIPCLAGRTSAAWDGNLRITAVQAGYSRRARAQRSTGERYLRR